MQILNYNVYLSLIIVEDLEVHFYFPVDGFMLSGYLHSTSLHIYINGLVVFLVFFG